MTDFAPRLIAWQDRHGRHDLPWQGTRDPYRVWLSEIMLQQTQVATVIPYYQRFLDHFPDLAALAAAPSEAVMAAWSGLGYYARARNLHACARTVMAAHGGRFPRQPTAIAALPGIGRSTANAIAVFCFDAREAILDGNVKRLLCRHFSIAGYPGTATVERELWAVAEALLPAGRVDAYIQAQMDMGATVCTRSRPRCDICPVAESCLGRRQGRVGELPAPRPKRKLPEREVAVLVLEHDGRVLLVARPPAGIWGGLLSLPELAPGETAAALASRLGCRITACRQLPVIEHGFTHFRLHLLPLHCRAEPLPHAAEPGGRWLDAAGIAAAALPAPIRRLLADFPSAIP